MAELKTKKNQLSVEAFLQDIPDKQKSKDAAVIASLMEKATKTKAKMWGSSIIGFGDRHLKYESGRELDWFIIGFSPRKQNIALYITGTVKNQQELLGKLGKHKIGKGCLYINKLSEVDIKVLEEIIKVGVK